MNIPLVCVQKIPLCGANYLKNIPYIRTAVAVVWGNNLALSSK